MKKTISILAVATMILITNQAMAQFGDLIKKVKESVVKDDPSKKLPPVYKFDYEYHMESEYKGKVDKYVFYMTADASVIALVEDKVDEMDIILTDHNIQKAKVYAIGKETGGKGIMGIPYIDMQKMAEKMQEKNRDKYSIVPTGKSKMIAGFSCKEYKTSDKKNTGYLYATTEPEISGFNLVGFSNVRMPKSVSNIQGLQNGVLMELTSHDKKKPNKNAITMRCTKLVKSDFTINNSEFHSVN